MFRKREAVKNWKWLFVPLVTMIIGCIAPSKKQTVLQKDKLQGIKRIAVLPFYNLSDRLDAEVIVTELFISEILHDQRFWVVKHGDLRQFLWQQGIRSPETVTRETLQSLVERFSVDGVLLGTINTYRDWHPDRAQDPSVIEISARLLDCEKGQILWIGREKITGQEVGGVLGVGEAGFCSQLIRQVARDFLKGLRADR